MKNKLRISYLLRPHWHTLSLAMVAVLAETLTDLLEPWPLKIVFDHVLGSKKMPHWLDDLVAHLGHDKIAILEFAALAVIAIAAVGSISTYFEKYLTTSGGQWAKHHFRRTLYHHIPRPSPTYHTPNKTRTLISTLSSAIYPIHD